MTSYGFLKVSFQSARIFFKKSKGIDYIFKFCFQIFVYCAIYNLQHKISGIFTKNKLGAMSIRNQFNEAQMDSVRGYGEVEKFWRGPNTKCSIGGRGQQLWQVGKILKRSK